MAQTILTLCDECLAAGDEVRGEPYGLTIETPGGRAVPYVLDACEQHAKPIRDMLTALDEHGRRTDRKQPLPRAATGKAAEAAVPVADNACPMCGQGHRTRTALTSHVKRVHGEAIAAVEGQATALCPAGCGRMVTSRAQGLSAHLRGTDHGMSRDEARATVAAAREQ